MRILISNEHSEIVGGVETYLQSLLRVLHSRGCEIGLLSNYPVQKNSPKSLIYQIGIPCWSFADSDPAKILNAISLWKPDCCYHHGFQNSSFEQSLRNQFPTFVYIHNYTGTCISGSKSNGLFTHQPCSRHFGLKCLALYFPLRCGGLNPLTMLQLYQQQKRNLSDILSSQKLAVASNYMRQEYLNHGVLEENITLLPYPIPGQNPDIEPPETRPLQNRIMMIGRLTDLKGGHLLIPALPLAEKKLGRSLSLIIAGDGPDLPRLKRLAEKHNTSVEFKGWINRSQREELMRSVDLLAVPSTWPEPFGLVGVEAGCVGLPAVAFNVGGIPDWCVSGETGELAPGDPPTVQGLADAIVRALSDPEHHQKLRVGAWKKSQEFTMEKHLARLLPLLESIANR